MSASKRRRRRSAARVIAMPLPSRRWVMVVGLALVLAVVAFTSLRLYLVANKISSHAGVGDFLGLSGNQENEPGTLAYKLHHGERVNVLLLGYGGAGHDGAYLTDSILVVSIQGPDRVALTSLPRDTYVKIKAFANGGEYDGKINAAYEIPILKVFGRVSSDYTEDFQGGGKLASKVIGDYLGMTIDYWVGVDFTAFRKVVEALGGADVVNPYTLDDEAYPLGETNGFMHVHFDQGPLHLDGERALEYVRERHADNDFGRSRRQQQVMVAIKDKALRLGAIPKLFDLLDALQDNVKTNLSLGDIRTFAGVAGRINSSATHHVSIDNQAWQYDTLDYSAGYILLPRDHTLNGLHHFIQNELPDPAVLKEQANIQFASSPGEASAGQSLAAIWAALLRMLNFQTMSPATVQQAPATTEIHDYSGGRARRTVAWLARYYNATVVTETPHSSPSPSAAPSPKASPAPYAGPPDVVVVLGRDFAAAFDSEERPVYTPPPATYVPPPPKPAPSQSAAPGPSPTLEPIPSQQPVPRPSPSAPCVPPLCHPSPKPTPAPV